jgi:hypothetical protein
LAAESGTSLTHLDGIDIPESPDLSSFKLPVFIRNNGQPA